MVLAIYTLAVLISGNLTPPTVTALAATFSFSPSHDEHFSSSMQLISLDLVLSDVVSLYVLCKRLKTPSHGLL